MERLIRILCAALGMATAALYAQTPAPAASTASGALPPDLQAELDALQRATWHPSASARASLGWRDNVLLSPFAPIERGFARGELEAILMRPMRNRWELISFLNGDVLRYFSPPLETRGEQQWSLHTEGRWQPIDRARMSLRAVGYLRDMVIDLSETEARRVVAPTRVRGAYLTAGTRLAVGPVHIEPAVQAKRTDYRDYAGDYDEGRAGARIEWRVGRPLTVSGAWFESDRSYDQREEFSASGRSLPGTSLRFRQRDTELKARTTFKAAGNWTLAATTGWLENRDRASGYFDYDQKRARLEVGWRREGWSVAFDGEAKRMDYLLQTVGAGISPPPRINDDHELTLRLERELNPRWSLFGEHRWERSRSNEMEFSYKANSVLAGLHRSF